MKVIVAGSRRVRDYRLINEALSHALSNYPITISELVEGEAHGVDLLAKSWAINNSIPVKPFRAKWDDLDVPDAVIKVSPWGRKYNARAGHNRNLLMANYGEALIAIWNGKSTGTKNMIEIASDKGLSIAVYMVTGDFSALAKDDGGRILTVVKNLGGKRV